MPELPEVEVTRRSLAAQLGGARIETIRMGKPLRWPVGIDVDQLAGWHAGELTRRGKYLWLPLSGEGGESGGFLIHLGMSGSLNFSLYGKPLGVHDHFEMATDRGILRLTDPRRFGAVVWGSSVNEGLPARLLAGLGLEPSDPGLTPAYLHARLKGRRVSVKQALLAGDIVVGAGNIYACEALFRAGIDPRTPAGRVSLARCGRLLHEVRTLLDEAVMMGGSSLRDFRDAHGAQGHFQLTTKVYGREGQPCRVCGHLVRKLTQGQRSTFYCPKCQKK